MAEKRRNPLGRLLQVAFCVNADCGRAICGCIYLEEKKIARCEECSRKWKCKIRVFYKYREELVSALKAVRGGNYGDLRHHYELADSVCAECCGIEPKKGKGGHCPASRHL